MRRREFITLLGGAAAAWPLAVRAEQRARLPTVGFFSPNTHSAAGAWTAAFVKRLREVGWIESSSWSSISKPPRRPASKSHQHCSPAPTR